MKIKNRKEFLRMMTDAERGGLEFVAVKDISRFAWNAIDFFKTSMQEFSRLFHASEKVNASILH